MVTIVIKALRSLERQGRVGLEKRLDQERLTMQSNEHQPSSRTLILEGARLPADRGLSSLGLLMQLAGSLSLAYMAVIALMPMFAGSGGGGDLFFLFICGASGAVRGAYHRKAGSALLYGSNTGSNTNPKKSIMTYVYVSLVETIIWLFVMAKGFQLPLGAIIPLAGILLAWPFILAMVVHHPRYQYVLGRHQLPLSEDQGFEGTSVYMLVFGTIGALFSGLLTVLLVISGGNSPEIFLVAAVFGMLTIRSLLQVKAGANGLRNTNADNATDNAATYYSFGIGASVITASAVLVLMMMSGLSPIGLMAVVLVLCVLLVWPLSLRRFYTERVFSTMLAGKDAPRHRRAPDGGLTALGWLLIAAGSLTLASSLPILIAGPGMRTVNILFGGLISTAHEGSAWWRIGLAGLELWAGLELIAMSDRYRIAGTIFGVMASLVSFYQNGPQLKAAMHDLHSVIGSGPMTSLSSYAFIAITLVIPILTIVLVNRSFVATATARISPS